MTTLTTTIVILLLIITHTTSQTSLQQPNIVMILADDQGVGDIGYNQNFYNSTTYNTPWRLNQPHTPHLNAMANSTNSILFHRFYSGASICSPTRASILSGRNPLRECIGNAEGCGTKPAWSCLDRLPFPLPTFTIAEAAKLANYSTIHLGKWHLGDFFYKGNGEHAKLNVNDNHRRQPAHAPSNYAYQKWPVSNPGMHGFDEWRSTEASAPSSTTNCDCNPIWGQEGNGCIDGGGKWAQHGEGCTNYWYPMDNVSHSCRNMSAPHSILAQHCVTNETKKIQGDDSKYIVDHFETFVQKNVALNQPFLALLWFHTVHEPHPAMPEFYHAYKDVYGDPAGDYLGTITQMDVQIGRIRNIVLENGIHNNTMIWYTADNGPHSANRDRSEFPALAATNGLRQCKASYYEGGIRVPGILEWPSVIKEHSNTWHPSGTVDYLHTILDVLVRIRNLVYFLLLLPSKTILFF